MFSFLFKRCHDFPLIAIHADKGNGYAMFLDVFNNAFTVSFTSTGNNKLFIYDGLLLWLESNKVLHDLLSFLASNASLPFFLPTSTAMALESSMRRRWR